MTGRGPNREVAYKLFGEAKSLYSEAVQQRSTDADNPANRRSPRRRRTSTKAAARWPDSALEEEALYLTGENAASSPMSIRTPKTRMPDC